jgi:hypothetical protein
MVPLRLFFADSPQKSFQYLRAGQPNLYIDTKLKSVAQLLCYTRNLSSYAFATAITSQKLGYVLQEIYLSEQERSIHINVATHHLIEQNIWFTGQFPSSGTAQTVQFQPTQFVHPCKWLMYGIQKAKYQNANAFLSY